MELIRNVFSQFSNQIQSHEWTVVSAIIAFPANTLPFVAALGTGTKCISFRDAELDLSGSIIHDSHAEVICRRSFIRWLLVCMKQFITNQAHALTNPWTSGPNHSIKLNSDWRFEFYSSHVPCGDASIYRLNNDTDDVKMNFSSARLCSHSPSTDLYESIQLKGQLRTKACNLNITSPSRSKSCSDKISKWLFVGWEGALVSKLIQISGELNLSGELNDAIRMTKLNFGCESEQLVLNVRESIEKCFCRGNEVQVPFGAQIEVFEFCPSSWGFVNVLSEENRNKKRDFEGNEKQNRKIGCNLTLNYFNDGGGEWTIGDSGVLRSKKSSNSRICKRQLIILANEVATHLNHTPPAVEIDLTSASDWYKQGNSNYEARKSLFFSLDPFISWHHHHEEQIV